jgi:RimJ/RimL family protein N-acetyltransferase
MPAITPPSKPLSDGVVSMRLWRPDDAVAVTAACQDAEISRWTHIPAPYDEADAREWLGGRAECWEQGREANFAVVGATNGELLASAGLVEIEWDDQVGEIGYWVAAPSRRQGVARRAVRLLCAWAFHDVGLYRLQITADVQNAASQAVAASCGFIREGVLRSNVLLKGRRRDTVVFSLLRSDPAATALAK